MTHQQIFWTVRLTVIVSVLMLYFLQNECSAQQTTNRTTTTEPDNSYGKGGTKVTVKFDAFGSNHVHEKYYDGADSPKLREFRITESNEKTGVVRTIRQLYNCDGTKGIYTEITKDALGNIIGYTKGQPKQKSTGFMPGAVKMEVDTDTGEKKYYKNNGGGWEETTTPIPEDQMKISHTGSKDCVPPDDLFAGLSLISEDGYERFATYGLNIAYTHPVSPGLGITGDLGINLGSIGGTDLTKLQLLAGISFFPGNNNSSVRFSPHALAGVVNVTSKFGTSKSNSTGFSVAIGTDINFRLSTRTAVGARVDYNPSFTSGTTQHNFRFAAGLVLRLGDQKHKTPDENIEIK